jgi:hypothetical protein
MSGRQEIHESKKLQQLNLEVLDFPNPYANHDHDGACSDESSSCLPVGT